MRPTGSCFTQLTQLKVQGPSRTCNGSQEEEEEEEEQIEGGGAFPGGGRRGGQDGAM